MLQKLYIFTITYIITQTLSANTNFILMIADGFGPASVTMARYVNNNTTLNIDKALVGSVRTYSASSLITDSAAAATAYATGVKTYNGAVAVNMQGKKLKTLLEAAQDKGYMTGMVVTSEITDATPAGFSSHVLYRDQKNAIALQQSQKNIDLILGGGKSFFLPEKLGGVRVDNRNLLDEMQAVGYKKIENKKELATANSLPLVGLFAQNNLTYEIDRELTSQPSLSAMTAKALALFEKSGKNFFLLVEGSRIDHAAHANDIGAHAREILEYDKTVELVQKFVENNPNTLVISTADHETGGLTVGKDKSAKLAYKFNPEIIYNVKHSTEYMFESLLRAESLEHIIKQSGLTDISRQEQSQLEELYSKGKDSYKELVQNLATMIDDRANVGWTTGSHTAVDVNLYAFGKGMTRFTGNHNNIDIARNIALELDLSL